MTKRLYDKDASTGRSLAVGLLLGTVLLLGLVLRLWGLDFGMPLKSNVHVRPDETLVVVPAVFLFGGEDAPSHLFAYPALMPTLCGMLYRIVHLGASIVNIGNDNGFQAHVAAHMDLYFLLARLVSALAGTAAIYLVYRMGKALSRGVGIGLFGALLYATAPLAVRDAHFAVTDTLLGCLSAGTALAFIGYLRTPAEGRRRAACLAGLLAGLALAAKYTALVLWPVGGLALLLAPGDERWKTRLVHGAWALGIALLVFLVVNPRILADPGGFLNDLSGEYRHQTEGLHEHPLPGSVKLYNPLRYGPGEILGLVLILVGALRPRRSKAGRPSGESTRFDLFARLIIIAAAVVYLAPIWFTSTPFFRYAVPALPFLSVLAARGLITPFRGGPSGAAILILLAAAALAPPLARSLRIDRLLSREDTRTLAGRWIEENVPEDVPVYFVGRPEQEPQLATDTDTLNRRIDDTMAIYGERGGEVLTALFRLRLAHGENEGGPRYRVHFEVPRRSPGPKGALVVRAFYPLSMAGYRGRPATKGLRSVIDHARFESLTGKPRIYRVDGMDAFFLPLGGLGWTERPGPHLDVLRIRGKTP